MPGGNPNPAAAIASPQATPSMHNWPAFQHANPALATSGAAGLAAMNALGYFYRAIVWNTVGVADVIDSRGALAKVVTVPGAVYPLANCGVCTGGNTSGVAQGDFTVLFD